MATIKQKKAFDKVVENGGNVSKGMLEAKYSPATAKTPQKLTTSKGWAELMEKHLPDDLLAKKHKELLTVPKKVRKFMKGDLEFEYEELDSQAVSKGLDMAYKIKGRYAAESQKTQVNVLVLSEGLAKKYAITPNTKPDSNGQ